MLGTGALTAGRDNAITRLSTVTSKMTLLLTNTTFPATGDTLITPCKETVAQRGYDSCPRSPTGSHGERFPGVSQPGFKPGSE